MKLRPADRCDIISGERTTGGFYNCGKCILAIFFRGGKCALWKNWISANGTFGDFVRLRGGKKHYFRRGAAHSSLSTSRRGELICIYCKQEKDKAAFNTEHLVPKSLGIFENNLTLHTVCSDCNKYLGDKLDLLIGRSSMEALLRFVHGVKSTSLISELIYTNLIVTYDG